MLWDMIVTLGQPTHPDTRLGEIKSRAGCKGESLEATNIYRHKKCRTKYMNFSLVIYQKKN